MVWKYKEGNDWFLWEGRDFLVCWEGLMEELIFKLRLKNECDGARWKTRWLGWEGVTPATVCLRKWHHVTFTYQECTSQVESRAAKPPWVHLLLRNCFLRLYYVPSTRLCNKYHNDVERLLMFNLFFFPFLILLLRMWYYYRKALLYVIYTVICNFSES